MSLIKTVDVYLGVHRIAPSRFGREVARDPQLVFDMRRGRVPGPALRARIVDRLGRAAQ